MNTYGETLYCHVNERLRLVALTVSFYNFVESQWANGMCILVVCHQDEVLLGGQCAELMHMPGFC